MYLDTSVISYLDQRDAPEQMLETLELWTLFRQKMYEVYISDIVMQEMSKCNPIKLKNLLYYLGQIDYTIVNANEKTDRLALKFIENGILKQKNFADCRHIAIAMLSGCHIITSWDFKHIVNAKTVEGANAIASMEGYKEILIYSPSMLLKGAEFFYGGT